MTDKIIIADAGPLIAFGRIKRLSLLAETLGNIIVPLSVMKECLSNNLLPGAKEISEAMEKQLIISHANPDISDYQYLFDILGPGEATAIILASQLNARLLIDEKLGRQTAQKMGLRIIGTAGVLVRAKKKNLIEKVAPLVHELKNTGYYLSEELIETIFILADEKD